LKLAHKSYKNKVASVKFTAGNITSLLKTT